MGTQIIAGNLDAELENARASLKGVEDNIKKVFGKDPSELNFQRGRRSIQSTGNDRRSFQYNEEKGGGDERRHSSSGGRGILDSNRLGRKITEDEPAEKRWKYQENGQRPSPVVISSRIKPRYDDEEEERPSYHNSRHSGGGGGGPNLGYGNQRDTQPRRLQSRVVSSVKEKSRDEVLAAQRQDSNGRDRNRRMFGALLGTLHRFKEDETKLKDKEDKRAQIEAKLDEADKQEREAVKKQKQQLIRDRKLKLTEIKRLEIKKRRLEELEEWETKTKYLKKFIRTETKPHIFYMPKILNPITECKLEESKMLVEEMIASKRQEVWTDLDNYEQRSKRYWDTKINYDGNESSRMLSTSGVEADPFDENMEDELKELMKGEDYEHDADHDDLGSSHSHEHSITSAQQKYDGKNGKSEESEQMELHETNKEDEPEADDPNHNRHPGSPLSKQQIEEDESNSEGEEDK